MDSDSTENQASGDGVKEILAPAEGPRENLINTAVKFLQNSKVQSSPLYQKKAFLEKKGLTQVEIDLAVQRAGVVETQTAQVQGGSPGQMVAQQAVGPPQVYRPGMVQPQYAPIPPQSSWARARDLTMTTVVVASVSYAVYQVFQNYLRPWLLGKTAQERRLERLEEEIKAVRESVQDSLKQISDTLAAIQDSLAKQQQQSLISNGELRGITDLKTDVASLKGLMLSKSQFPAAPTAAPILPSWQRASAASSSSALPAPSPSAAASTVKAPASTSSTSQKEEAAPEDVNGLDSKVSEGEKEAEKQTASELQQEEKQESRSDPPSEPTAEGQVFTTAEP